MAHIHTEPDQHDMTIGMYIVLTGLDEPKVLVHMHRKHNVLMQIGGHIELNETPWQAVAHELTEESGYTLDELQVLQPDSQPVTVEGAVVHPVPVLMNTHKISDEHYHSDLCYAFVADAPPKRPVASGESDDLRWLTLAELKQHAELGEALKRTAVFYDIIVSRYLKTYCTVPTARYSTGKPH